MVSCWRIDSYFNTEQIQIGDAEIMISVYGSPGSFISRVRSKSIGHNTYTGRRSNLRSKPTPIYGPVNKPDLNYSYSISHFSRLPQAVPNYFNCLSQKVSHTSKIIDPVINEFSTNDVSIYLHICDQSIITFGIREKFIGLSKTSYADSLDRFRRLDVDKAKKDICILQKSDHKKKENTICK